jgi:hypothetical protein
MRPLALAVAALALAAAAQAQDGAPIPVTPDNFARAESDMYFGEIVGAGALGRFRHDRALKPVEEPVIRPNRDTLYSGGVFDLDAGPVTITLPEAGGRFMSLQVIDEDHYVRGVFYGPGSHTLDREAIGTRYAVAAVRILVDPSSPEDMAEVHRLQDAIAVDQPGGPGAFEAPSWDPASQKTVRDALLVLNTTLTDSRGMFGARDEVDPVRHLIGSAMGWGGNPEKDALYLPITPERNDGSTVHRLTVGEVPVDGFWSVTVYDAQGHLLANPYEAYSLNSITADKGADGSVEIQFGGCDGQLPNCLPVTPGWNYLVRLYRPRPEVLDGTWTFPEPRVE